MPGKGRVAVGVSILLLLASARGAEAVGKGWLEKLSGPGHFAGFETTDIPLWCFGMERLKGFGCAELGSKPHFFMVGLSYANLDSTKNDLEYEDGTSADARKVNLQTWTLSLNRRIHPLLDVGVGVSTNRFDGQLFSPFRKVSFDLPRVVIRPLALIDVLRKEKEPVKLGPVRVAEILQVKLRLAVFPGELTASDFGAVEGTYRESGEWLGGVSIGFGITMFW
jgi:hypothetical protein